MSQMARLKETCRAFRIESEKDMKQLGELGEQFIYENDVVLMYLDDDYRMFYMEPVPCWIVDIPSVGPVLLSDEQFRKSFEIIGDQEEQQDDDPIAIAKEIVAKAEQLQKSWPHLVAQLIGKKHTLPLAVMRFEMLLLDFLDDLVSMHALDREAIIKTLDEMASKNKP